MRSKRPVEVHPRDEHVDVAGRSQPDRATGQVWNAGRGRAQQHSRGAWLAVGWTDAAGDFWLFGGEGFDSVGTGAGVTDLNDLWKYSGGQWTWMSGSDIANQLGTYGTQGTADPGNSPGAREAPAAWIDPSGNLGSSADTPSGCYPRESSTTCGCTTHKGRAVTPLIGLEGTSVTFLTGCGNGMGKGSPLTLGGPLSGRTAVFINR